MFLGISFEDWKIINTFAPWFSAFGTISVAIISLYLASLHRKVSLNITSNISISDNSTDRFCLIKAVNDGNNSIKINDILLEYGLGKKNYVSIGENDISEECSSLLPHRIEVGDVVSLCVNISRQNDFFPNLYKNIKKDSLYGFYWLNIITALTKHPNS